MSFCFFKQKTAYEMRISDWSSDVCSSDLRATHVNYLTQLAVDPSAWLALATLIVMDVVLGIDNLIFISILTNKLPEQQRSKARRVGIALALILRLGLLGTVAWIVQLTEPVIELLGKGFRSEEHTSELQSLMRSSYAVFCLKKNKRSSGTD